MKNIKAVITERANGSVQCTFSMQLPSSTEAKAFIGEILSSVKGLARKSTYFKFPLNGEAIEVEAEQ